MEQFKRFLMEQDIPRRVRVCYQCGVCAGGCPVGKWRWDFNPRRFIEMILRDEIDDIIKDDKIWLCAACHTCLERCPQTIEVSEIMMQLKNAAARIGSIPENQVKMGREIMKTGWTQTPGKRTLRIRRELGLPEIPRGIRSRELRNLMDCLGLPEQLKRPENKDNDGPDRSVVNPTNEKKEKNTE